MASIAPSLVSNSAATTDEVGEEEGEEGGREGGGEIAGPSCFPVAEGRREEVVACGCCTSAPSLPASSSSSSSSSSFPLAPTARSWVRAEGQEEEGEGVRLAQEAVEEMEVRDEQLGTRD